MHKLSYYFKKPNSIKLALLRHLGFWLPDKVYIKTLFPMCMGYQLNLDNPKTFAEKMQWIKLNDCKPIYHQMVDKVDCKSLITNIIGGGTLYPLSVCITVLNR